MSSIVKNIDIIINELTNGNVVVIPTDTVFGLACSIYNENAIKKIFQIKQRPLQQPLSIAIKNKEYFNIVSKEISDIANKIIDKYFPGQVTIVLKKTNLVSNIITGNQDYVGIRIPDDKNIQYILNNIDFPIVLTSANIHGYPNCESVYEVNNQIGEHVNYILDGKINKNKYESTVVKVVGDKIDILRQGIINITL